MKILYIFKSMALMAGMERVLSSKMNWLAQNGYDITFVTYEQGKHPLSFSLDKRIKHIDLGVCFYEISRLGYMSKVVTLINKQRLFKKRLEKIILAINPDIVINSNYDYHQIPSILKSSPNAKHILESHVVRATEMSVSHVRKRILIPFAKIYDKWISGYIKKYSVIVSLTKEDSLNWFENDNRIVIPNSVDIPEYHAHDRRNIALSVGRLNKQKGFDLLLIAWKKLALKYPTWNLNLYGDGEMKEELCTTIAQDGIGANTIIYPSTKEIHSKYQDASFYVMSSRYEGFGMVLVEAMSHGTPCISFDCPHGPSSIIEHGKNGLLVENGNIDELAKAIEWMITNPEERKQMGVCARKSVERFSIERVMNQWKNLFESLV